MDSKVGTPIETTTPLISLKDAARLGIRRLRKPIWASKFDHIQIDIVKGELGVWVHLYCPSNLAINKRDPVDILTIEGLTNCDFVPYTGPLSDSEEYLAEAKIFTDNAIRMGML